MASICANKAIIKTMRNTFNELAARGLSAGNEDSAIMDAVVNESYDT